MESKEIIDALQWRYATKKYDTSKKLEKEKLHTILEAGRLAPSSFGTQPWAFIAISNAELKSKLAPHAYNQPQIESASHLIVLCGYDKITEQHVHEHVAYGLANGGEKERLENYRWMLINRFAELNTAGIADTYISNQVYIALGSMILTAAALRVDASPMGWFNPDAFDEVLWLKEKWLHAVVLLALGYRDETDSAAHVAKVRRPEDKVITYID